MQQRIINRVESDGHYRNLLEQNGPASPGKHTHGCRDCGCPTNLPNNQRKSDCLLLSSWNHRLESIQEETIRPNLGSLSFHGDGTSVGSQLGCLP